MCPRSMQLYTHVSQTKKESKHINYHMTELLKLKPINLGFDINYRLQEFGQPQEGKRI